MHNTFSYGTGHLTSGICLSIASGKIKGIIDTEAAASIKASREEVKKILTCG